MLSLLTSILSYNSCLTPLGVLAFGRIPMPENSKTNWLKDLLFPIVVAVLGAFLGVFADEYKMHLTSPKLRHGEIVNQLDQMGKLHRQKVSTTLYLVGQPVIQDLIVDATVTHPGIRIAKESFSLEPSDQRPQVRQIEKQDSGELMRSFGVVNFHKPQRITWSIEAESLSPPSSALVRFSFRGVNDVENESQLHWTDRLPLLNIALGLLIYSTAVTTLAVFFRFRRRSSNEEDM